MKLQCEQHCNATWIEFQLNLDLMDPKFIGLNFNSTMD